MTTKTSEDKRTAILKFLQAQIAIKNYTSKEINREITKMKKLREFVLDENNEYLLDQIEAILDKGFFD